MKLPSLKDVIGDYKIGDGDFIERGSSIDKRVGDTIQRASDEISRQVNKHTRGYLDKLSEYTGGLFDGSLSDIFNPSQWFSQNKVFRPSSGFEQYSNSEQYNGWYPLLKSRPDPLWEIDWFPIFPLGLPPEYVESVQWSHPRFMSEEAFRNGRKLNYITGIETNPISVELYENRFAASQDWYNNWRSIIWQPASGTFSYPYTYKKNIHLLLRDVKQQVVAQVLFTGCFPSSPPQITSSSEGGRVKLSIEFSVDEVFFEAVALKQQTNTDIVSSTVASSFKNGLNDSITGALKNFSSSAQSLIDTSRSSRARSIFNHI